MEPASALPQTRRLLNCNKKRSSMTRRIRRKKIIMKFSHMSLVLVFLLHGLGGCTGSQDAAKLTVNFGKLIRHSLGTSRQPRPEKKVKLENAAAPTHSALV